MRRRNLSPVFLRKYCLLMTLLPDFLVNFLEIFLSLLMQLLTDTVFFLNGHLKICPFTKILSVNNFINRINNTL